MIAKQQPYLYTRHYMRPIGDLKTFVKTLDGMKVSVIRKLSEQLDESRGNPQKPMDWKVPDKWIPRLKADGVLTETTADAAWHIVKAGLNPRHFSYAIMRIVVRHGYLGDRTGTLRLTDDGKRFIAGDNPVVDQFLYKEGCMEILAFVHDHNGAQLKDILPLWCHWLNTAAGKDVNSKNLQRDSMKTRIRGILIPLGLIRQEGIPRKYTITDKGVKKYQALIIRPNGNAGESKHALAIRQLLEVGKSLGYQTEKEPSLSSMLPQQKLPKLKGKVFNKKVDAVWRTNLPLVGEIRIAAEVQASGGIPDLLYRLKIVAPHCHYLIIVSDELQIREIRDSIAAHGDEKAFGDKIIYLTFEELTEIRIQATNISSKLRPSFTDTDDDDSEVDVE